MKGTRGKKKEGGEGGRGYGEEKGRARVRVRGEPSFF